MKKYIKRNMMVMAIYTILGIAVIGCNPKSSGSSYACSSQDEISQTSEVSSPKDGTTWIYYQDVDDLTNAVTGINASVVSTNSMKFNSYGNTTKLVLTLQYSAITGSPSTWVMLYFTDDNHLCRFSDFQGQGFLAVFDNEGIDDRWSLVDRMGSKRNSLSMTSSRAVVPFVEKLKSSKTLRIQVNLEHVGKTTFDFNVEGLKWDFEN